MATCFTAWAYTAAVDGAGDPSSASDVELRLARSRDGLHFEESGAVLLVGAESPDLTVLSNGDVLLLFDRSDRKGHGMPLATRSRDGGRTWSSVRPIRVRGGGRQLDVRRPTLVPAPGGYYRLFFAARASGRDRDARAAVIRSAVTRDGVHYVVDRSAHMGLPRGAELNPVAGWIGQRLHLYASELQESRSRDYGGVLHVISRDGEKFLRLSAVGEGASTFVGSLVPMKRGVRAFLSIGDHMRALDSLDGMTWRRRSSAVLPKGRDPAVVEVDRGEFLMVFVAPRSAEGVSSSQLVSAEPVAGDWADLTQDKDWTEDEADEASADSAEGSDDAAGEEHTEGQGKDESSGADDSSKPDAAEAAAKETVALNEDFGADGGSLAGYDPVAWGGFAPFPDFVHKVNYLEWYGEYALPRVVDNAYPYYAAMIAESGDQPGDKPEWPKFVDMYHGDYDGPPFPWSAKDHPDWAATSEAAADLFAQYRQATHHDGYSYPVMTDQGPDVNSEDRDLLIGILLPSLSSHRTMAKALLADAWRADDGKVSPDRMRDAVETTLRAANHMHQGATLIEDLVGTAVAGLTRENARWALHDGVFGPADMERMLDTLQRYDTNEERSSEAIRGEHAFAMDITQHLFTQPTANGQPHFNRARAERAFEWWDTPEHSKEMIERAGRMTPDDVYASLEATDAYYHELGAMMDIGYPDVRAADLDALTQRYLHTSPLTESILPALSRYYKLSTRGVADRRATQLAFATELFKAQHGRYPESLAELPSDFGETMKVDPFTGNYFGYQLTDNGPRIYSRSEDGLDGGGVNAPHWDDKPAENGSDDHVFYPPQR